MTGELRTNPKSAGLGYKVRFFPARHSACVIAVLALAIGATRIRAQNFSSGSTGSDGAYNPTGAPGTVVTLNPTDFPNHQGPANIFNFTTITIPQGVTVKLAGNVINEPVYWLASGNVDIEGTVDLSGGVGANDTANPFLRVPSVPGSGGYAGGVGGNNPQAPDPSQMQPPLPGEGPGGGLAGTPSTKDGAGGIFSGNPFLIPLVGGSGGGGGGFAPNPSSIFCGGGGAGGGALLIASSTQIVVNGAINANGGAGGGVLTCNTDLVLGGGGSGGAIRLVSNTISGGSAASLTATGGLGSTVSPHNGGPGFSGPGVIRLEATTVAFNGSITGTLAQSTKFPLLLPTAGSPTATVISINGVSIAPNPTTFPDITINTASPVPVVIQTQNIPVTATISLTILDENAVPDTVIQAPPLSNCTVTNICTTTVQVTFPFGASRGLTRITWTQ